MLDLLHPFPGNSQILLPRILGFLYEGMEYDDALTDNETVKCPSNTFSTARPQLK
jgi:hypothetical protein